MVSSSCGKNRMPSGGLEYKAGGGGGGGGGSGVEGEGAGAGAG